MAARSRFCFCVFLVALLPTFASCIRPFRVPKSLFVQGTSPFTLPEGAHEIRREDDSEISESPEELVGDLRGQLRSRFRRGSPTDQPQPEKSSQSLAQSFDTLYMYWPRNSGNENYVFLLAKNTKRGSDQSISKVYVSRNYGKNFTDLGLISKSSGKAPLIHQIYSSKADPKLCILADKANKVLYRSEDLVNFTPISVLFQPSFIVFHPSNRQFAMAYDSSAEMLYWSNDAGNSFTVISEKVKSFHWGVEGIHDPNTIFVEMFRQDRDTTKDNRTKVYLVANGVPGKMALAEDVEEFEVMKNYMFITTRQNPSDKNPVMKVAKIVKGTPISGSFKEATFPLNEESRDFFVFDVVEDYVFVVINHKRNLSNMYVSDTMGVKYQLSLPRVLYHNPYTDVSSPWLRTAIPYAFVDVDKIKGVRGIYIATQLTPGPVGKRHLLSLITYNRGGKWQRVRSPTVDNRGVRINCYLPSCSIHVNLMYGAVYRVSPSERLFSSESAPGLVLALGVASTNLKIYPDLFMSLDGGLGWSRVLRGKYLFTFGDHGGVMMAVPYRRYTRSLRYSIDGGATWKAYTFSSSASVLARDVVTQPGERLPVFLIYGTVAGQGNSKWTVFYINMTSILGSECNSSGYVNWTDGCILGRQQQFETRNWTIHCHMGRNYARAKIINNCPCSRDDFQCDYGFQRKAIDEECAPIRQGEDLNHAIIPAICPEGQNYTRTRGFRKIPGDTCVNGTEKDFLSVSTPCPVKELLNLTLDCANVNDDGIPAIVTGRTASFNVSLLNGYYQNVNFKWFFGDGHSEAGAGEDYRRRQHKYDKAGKFVVSVIASNTRSILVARLDLNVQEKLDEKKMAVTFKPKTPGVNEDVIFSASLNYSNVEAGNVHYKWKYDDGEIQGWQPVATLQFKSSKIYNVSITAKNYVSEAKKIVQVQVTKDLTPVKVVARVLGPRKVLVKWDFPVHADSSIKGYRVYQSTTGLDGFTQSSCNPSSDSSCGVMNLTPATTYYFKVQAFTKTGENGPFSDFVVATTNTSAPGAPRKLQAKPIGPSIINVEWLAPATPNGKITSYKIRYWSNHNSTAWTVDNGLALSRKFTGLLQDTYYFFEVYAVSAKGRSIADGPVQAITGLSPPTETPREIKKVSDNGTCALLTWKAPYFAANDKRAFPAKGYKLEVDAKHTIIAATTFKIVCELKPGQVYNVKVRAYSEAGDGPPASINMTTQSVKPGPPQNVRCGPVSPTQIIVNWDAPAQGGTDGITYEVYQVSPYKAVPYTAPKTSYPVPKLRPYTSYKFSVIAKNRLGSSVKSAPVTCTTSETTPGVVRFVTAEPIDPKQATIKITWSTPDEPNGKITGYKIRWGKVVVSKPSSNNRPNEVSVSGSTSAYTFKNLFSSTSYFFIVFPVNNAGTGSQHIDAVNERTFAARKGTERLQLEYDGARMNGEDSLKFIPNFIEAATTKAGIPDVRLAAVVVKDGGKVLFDLLPPLKASGVPMDKAKLSLNDGFKALDWKLIAGTLKRVFVYAGDTSPTPGGNGDDTSKAGGKPSVAAQKGARTDDSSSKKTYLAIAIPLALIGIALLGGMIFYFMKYKSLQKHYGQMSDRSHEEDEMKVVYHEEMEADSPDEIFNDRSKKGRKFYKDSEKVPLGDSDELAMI